MGKVVYSGLHTITTSFMRHLWLYLSILVFSFSNCKKVDQQTYIRPTTIELTSSSTGLNPVISKMTNGDSVTIVCYGNSITYGGVDTPYPEALEQLWRSEYNNNGIVVHNQGQPGWTAEMANNKMDSLVLAYQPDMVTITFGINDLAQGLSLQNYATNMHAMVSRLKQQGVTVLVMSPTPLAFDLNKPLLNFCKEAAHVADSSNVAFMHMHGAMVTYFDSTQTDTEIQTLMPDLVHYNQEGYLLIADRLMQWWQGIE